MAAPRSASCCTETLKHRLKSASPAGNLKTEIFKHLKGFSVNTQIPRLQLQPAC